MRKGLVILAFLAVALAACGDDNTSGGTAGGTQPAGGGSQTTTAPTSAAMQAVIDGARHEGKLTLIFGGGIFGGASASERLVDAFKDYYDLDIDVQFTPGPSQGDMQNRVVEEFKSGQPASTDVLNITALPAVTLARDGVITKVDWDFAPNLQDPRSILLDGSAVLVERWIMGFSYNTSAVKGDAVPKMTEDLLKPEFKGRTLTTSYAAGFDVLLTNEAWGAAKTTDFVTKFSKAAGGLARCSEVPRLATGEFDLFAFSCSPADALRAKADGAPIDFGIFTDAAMTYQNLLTVPANSAHPNAAKLFINFMVSPEAQKILRDVDYADNPFLDGSITAKQIADAEAKGAKFVHADDAFYARNDFVGTESANLQAAGQLIKLLRGQ
jgi:iron(III) transport system substrate-binding protein